MSRETSTPPHWQIVISHGGNQESVEDTEHNSRLFFLATSGFGTNSTALKLAQKVCDYLNSLPPEETLPYPYTWKPLP